MPVKWRINKNVLVNQSKYSIHGNPIWISLDEYFRSKLNHFHHRLCGLSFCFTTLLKAKESEVERLTTKNNKGFNY